MKYYEMKAILDRGDSYSDLEAKCIAYLDSYCGVDADRMTSKYNGAVSALYNSLSELEEIQHLSKLNLNKSLSLDLGVTFKILGVDFAIRSNFKYEYAIRMRNSNPLLGIPEWVHAAVSRRENIHFDAGWNHTVLTYMSVKQLELVLDDILLEYCTMTEASQFVRNIGNRPLLMK